MMSEDRAWLRCVHTTLFVTCISPFPSKRLRFTFGVDQPPCNGTCMQHDIKSRLRYNVLKKRKEKQHYFCSDLL